MFAKGADLAEVRAVVGHEMGHYKHGHVYWLVLVFSVLAVALLWIADRVFPWAARLMGSPAEVISDPVGLPVVMALVAMLGLFATPVVNTMTRLDEAYFVADRTIKQAFLTQAPAALILSPLLTAKR